MSLQPKAIQKAEAYGVSLDELKEMVLLSARCTHKFGNRRYHNYLLQVQGEDVLDFVRLDDEDEVYYQCDHCKDEKRVVVFDTCELCDGVGCRYCDKGLVQNFIDCQACKNNKKDLTNKLK